MLLRYVLVFICFGFALTAYAQTPPPGRGSAVLAHGRQFDEAKSLNPVRSELYPFYHGVASGDPLEDRVIIWTRVTPDSLNGEPVEVTWRMATDTALADVVASGTFTTDANRDYTVKIDVTGLTAGSTYYYGFSALNRNSLTGKTKTTPTAATSDHLKFGVMSCSNFQAGYFNAYGHLAERTDLDAVIHLGDYIYEYGNFVYGDSTLWDERLVEPGTEIVSLFDYRTRYSTYRLDSNLMRLHQQHPIVSVWDDHESTNDSYEEGAENHQPATEGDWESRKDRSRRVYFEWMPIRDTNNRSIYRKISYGDLADLIMLDTRLEGRDAQINDITDPALYAPDRTILGQTQKDWFKDQLTNSTARWKVVGQQVIFSHFNVGWAGAATGASFTDTESIFLDIWDGYPAERTELINFITDNDLDNVVLLTGDFHSSFGFEVTDAPVNLDFRPLIPGTDTLPFYDPSPLYDPTTGGGAVAVEFATPSITAANFDENIDAATAAGLQFQINAPIPIPGLPGVTLGNPNPHMKFTDLIQHGYYILDLKPDSVQANWYYTDISTRDAGEDFGFALSTRADTSFLTPVGTPSAPKLDQDVPAPANPPAVRTSTRELIAPVVLSLFPNPTAERVELQYGLRLPGRLRADLLDAGGRRVRNLFDARQDAGLYTLRVSLAGLPAGSYFVRLETPTGTSTQRVIKR